MWPAIGAGISALGSVAGGFLQSQGQQSANRLAEAQFDYNAQKQEEYFKNAILFRVQDAKRAGIHPLAALGAQIASPAAIPVGGGVGDTGLGAGFAQAGQDIGRAVSSMKRTDEKEVAMRDAISAATLAKTQAEIDYIRSMTVRNLAPSPGVPVSASGVRGNMLDGQGNSPNLVKPKLNEVTITAPGSPHREPGVQPDVAHGVTGRGTYTVIPGKEFKDRSEDMSWLPFQWFIRNHIMPMLNEKYRTPPGAAPLGKIWVWDGIVGEWSLRDRPAPSGQPRVRGETLRNWGIPNFGRR